jgi:hypothetical protein
LTEEMMGFLKSKVLFLSHAVADNEIALSLKKVLEASFTGLEVFVSSDPEDLPPGDPWVTTVLSNLRAAFVIWVLATERGLSRKWVWFEAGAGWDRHDAFIPCCLGKIRKGSLPAPYSHYQAVNIDEVGDLKALFSGLPKTLGSPSYDVDYSGIVADLIRLDVRAEERARIALSPFAAEVSAKVKEGMAKLGRHEREALRQLLIEGQLTDRRAVALLQQRGLVSGALLGVFHNIELQTGFVQQARNPTREDHLLGYDGAWLVNPSYRSELETYFTRETEGGHD